jgi:hypothetical protein
MSVPARRRNRRQILRGAKPADIPVEQPTTAGSTGFVSLAKTHLLAPSRADSLTGPGTHLAAA